MKAGDKVIFSGTRMDLQRLGLNKNNIDIDLKKVQIVESIGPGNFLPSLATFTKPRRTTE